MDMGRGVSTGNTANARKRSHMFCAFLLLSKSHLHSAMWDTQEAVVSGFSAMSLPSVNCLLAREACMCGLIIVGI